MRLALLGLGAQGAMHRRALKQITGVELAAVVVRDAKKAHARARRLGVDATEDARAVMSDLSIAGVVVATPTATHCAFVCAALEAGKHVFCETPIAHSVEEADRMVAAAKTAARVLQIGFIHRFEPALPQLAGLATSGRHGRIIGIETERLSPLVASGQQKPHHGDAIEELLAFDVHNLMWLYGRPIAVSATSRGGDNGVDEVCALIEFEDFSARCFATNRMKADHAFVERMRVRCDRATLVCEAAFSKSGVSTRIGFEGGEDIAIAANDPIHDQMAHFIEAMQGAHCAAPGDVARDVLAVTLAVRAAATSGRRVRV